MSGAYVTEQQQIEQISLWWKNNGKHVLLFIIVLILVSIGWRYAVYHHENKLERASNHYETLLSAVVNEDQVTAMKEAALLKNNYNHTPYAAMASLMLARNDVYTDNYQAAEQELQWVMKHASTDALKQVARLRLARIKLQLNQPNQSLALLSKVNDAAYMSVIDELKGDSYLALKQPGQAKWWYEKIFTRYPEYTVSHPILRMKIDDLASVTSQESAQGA